MSASFAAALTPFALNIEVEASVSFELEFELPPAFCIKMLVAFILGLALPDVLLLEEGRLRLLPKYVLFGLSYAACDYCFC